MTPLKVLIVEDLEEDAALLLLHLKRSGYDVDFERVQTAETMKAALYTKSWDIVISDFQMPNFNGLEAYRTLKESKIDLPFIIISGTIGEEVAVRAMVAGVNDYMMKDNLARLVPAIERELQEAKNRRAKREAEKALQESEERYRDLFENANDAIYTTDLNGNYTSVNKKGEELTGYTREEILQTNFADLLSEKDALRVRKMIAQKLADGAETTRYELELTAKGNRRKNVEVNSRIIYENGQAIAIQGIARDITMRKQLENDLRESEKRLQLALTAAGMGVWEWNVQTDEVYWSPECLSVLETSEPARYLSDFQKSLHPDDVEMMMSEAGKAIEHHSIYEAEFRFINPQGDLLWLANRGIAEYDDSGIPARVIGTVLDITERKQAEKELRESEENFRALVQATTQVVWTMHPNGDGENTTQWWLDLTGQTAEEATNLGWLNAVHPDDRERTSSAWQKSFKDRILFDTVYRVLTVTGEYRYYAVRSVPVFDEAGNFRQWIGTFTDITERKTVEEKLRESEARLQLSQQAARVGTWEWNLETGETIWSDGIWLLIGLKPGEIESNYENWAKFINPEDVKSMEDALQRAIKGTEVLNSEFRIITNDGRILWLASKGRVIRNEEGKAERLLGVNIDITERKQAEEDLRKSEEKLRQAQKLESIGRLAGGIAHDFNNMLTAINGYSDLSLRRLPADNPVRGYIEEIKKAGERSAALTHQLLAFSRRQILQPKVLNINQVLSETTVMLQRLIGEDIHLVSALSSDIGQIEADPGQISQVIMNLVVNSRDAMPSGGIITIETENVYLDEEFVNQNPDVKIGDYVLLAVSDTGSGIKQDMLELIFEPFYTTKEIGKGTGLGLATVYGIVKQSGGCINVKSTVNKGTTFEIYLPRIEQKEEKLKENVLSEKLLQGTETILIVEDEHMVRRLTKQILESYNYNVIEAENGEEALEVCEIIGNEIDLLLSDIVMPKMGGYELAKILLEDYPQMKILFTSGYTEESIIKNHFSDAKTNFIHKPYDPDTLALKVREILNSR